MADRLRTLIRNSALDESEAFRDETREMVLRALDGLPPLPRPEPIVIAPPREREPISVRTVMIGFAMVFVVLGAVVWSALRPPPEPAEATTTTVPARTTTVDPASALLDELRGHTWVLTGAAGDLTISVSRPYLEFIDDPATLTRGFDGCNVYSQKGTIADGRMSITDGASTTAACPDVASLLPTDGDRLATSVDGAELLLLTDGSSAPRLTYRRIDRLGSMPTDVTGVWDLGDERIELRDDGTATFADCTATWTFAAGVLRLADVAGSAGAPCLQGTIARDLVGVDLTPAAATSTTMWLVDDPHAVLLERVGAPAPAMDPNGITLGVGAAFGLRPGDAVSVDAEIDRISAAFSTPRSPDVDTGWYDIGASGDPSDCGSGGTYRVVWWGDLRLAFVQRGGKPTLWSWSVGDRDVIGYGTSEPNAQPSVPPVVLVTESGISVGADDTHVDRNVFSPTQPGAKGIDISTMLPAEPPLSFDGTVVVGQREGIVVGYGAQLSAC